MSELEMPQVIAPPRTRWEPLLWPMLCLFIMLIILGIFGYYELGVQRDLRRDINERRASQLASCLRGNESRDRFNQMAQVDADIQRILLQLAADQRLDPATRTAAATGAVALQRDLAKLAPYGPRDCDALT